MTNLIFDLGGVLINYDLQADVEALAAVGLPDYFNWKHHPQLQQLCNLYLNGLMPEDEFLPRLRPFARPDASDAELIHSMIAVMSSLPKSRLDTLVELRCSHQLILLSNINQRTWQYAVQQFQQAGYRVEDCFDHVFLSFELQQAKPDPTIFQTVISRTGIDPSDTLFLDDTRDNVDAALRLGINSWLVPMNSPEAQLEMLKSHKY